MYLASLRKAKTDPPSKRVVPQGVKQDKPFTAAAGVGVGVGVGAVGGGALAVTTLIVARAELLSESLT